MGNSENFAGKRLGSPPAIWLAFASQGRWKNWVMLAQLLVLAFMTQVCFAMAKTKPDVVVVDEKGEGHFVARAAGSEALVRFLDTEQKRPTDVTLLAFSERFTRLTSAVNSATIDEAWVEALGMMAPPLATKMEAEAKAQKLIETYRLAQVRTSLVLDEAKLVERRGDKAHVQLTVTRHKTALFGTSTGTSDRQTIDLILSEVPRSRRKPDGLDVWEWRTAAILPTYSADGGGDVRVNETLGAR